MREILFKAKRISDGGEQYGEAEWREREFIGFGEV